MMRKNCKYEYIFVCIGIAAIKPGVEEATTKLIIGMIFFAIAYLMHRKETENVESIHRSS